MTIPAERTRSLLRAEEVLIEVLHLESVDLPQKTRDAIRGVLRHYPTRGDILSMAQRESKLSSVLMGPLLCEQTAKEALQRALKRYTESGAGVNETI